MTFRIHRLTTLRAKRAAARGNLHPPMSHAPQLRTGTPKSNDTCLFGFGSFGNHLSHHQHQQIIFCIVSKADFAYAEKRIDRWMDMHLFFLIFRNCFGQVGKFFVDFRQELLQADGQGLDLQLFEDQGDRALTLPALQVKDALTWLTNGIRSYMRNGVEVNIDVGHKKLVIKFLPVVYQTHGPAR